MVGTSKILTVSYGTFSCTLEGFDDPFATMRSIAEYFRDLAAEDRYFGAEPPVPDPQMLHQIAEREVQKRVIAKVDQGSVVLRQVEPEPPAPAPAPVPVKAPAAAAPQKKRKKDRAAVKAAARARAMAAEAAPALDVPAGPPVEGESITAKMSRIRAAVARAAAAESYVEDEPAQPLFARSIDAAFADVTRPAPQAETPAPAEEAREEADDEAFADEADEVFAEEAAAEAVEEHGAEEFEDSAEPVAEAADEEPADEEFAEEAAADTDEDTAQAAFAEEAEEAADEEAFADSNFAAPEPVEPEEAQALAEPGEDAAAFFAGPAVPEIDDLPEDDAEALNDLARTDGFADIAAAEAASEPEDGTEPEVAPPGEDFAVSSVLARLRMAVNEAAEDLPDETAVEVEAEVVPGNDQPAPEPGKPARLVRARVIKMKRTDFEEITLDPGSDDDAEEGGIDADPRAAAEDPDEALARAISAFAADPEPETEAEDFDDGDLGEDLFPEPEEASQTRPEEERVVSTLSEEEEADLMKELAEVEREAAATRPAREGRSIFGAEASVTRILRETESQLDDTEASRRRSTIAHLKAAVAATRADRDSGAAAEDDDDTEVYRDDLDRVVRPRRPADSRAPAPAVRRMAPLMLVSEQRIDLPPAETASPDVRPRRVTTGNLALMSDADLDSHAGAGDEDNLFADSTSFAEYVDRMGATELPDILEAAAAYAAYVEGRPHFSRPQLMKQIASFGDGGFSREDGLRSFGALLRQGKIQKLKRGQFTIAKGSRFRPESFQRVG